MSCPDRRTKDNDSRTWEAVIKIEGVSFPCMTATDRRAESNEALVSIIMKILAYVLTQG